MKRKHGHEVKKSRNLHEDDGDENVNKENVGSNLIMM